jgi:transposase
MQLARWLLTWQGCGMKAIPVPVRERILHLYDQGKSTCAIAASLGDCVAAVRRVRQHFQARGTLEPQTHRCGRKTLLTARRRERLQTLVAQRPDATLAELGARFQRPTSTLDWWLTRLGLSFKKNAARRRAVAARRGGAKKTVAAAAGGRAHDPPGVRG